MADYISRVDTDKLREASDKIKTQHDIMQACMEDMKKKVNTLTEEYFKSEAGRLYRTKYENVTNNLNGSLSKLMRELTAIRTAAGIYEEGNKETTGNVSSLSEKTIFVNK